MSHGALFRLTQRLPDQTRAFFLARGFAPDDADFLARNGAHRLRQADRNTERLGLGMQENRVEQGGGCVVNFQKITAHAGPAGAAQQPFREVFQCVQVRLGRRRAFRHVPIRLLASLLEFAV